MSGDTLLQCPIHRELHRRYQLDGEWQTGCVSCAREGLDPKRHEDLPRREYTSLEDTFAEQIRLTGLAEPVREHRFDTKRRWRFDFAWPDRMLAVEIDGGLYTMGRHNNPQGYERDCEKLNAAAIAGWKVLRFTPPMVRDGRALATLEKGLGHVKTED